MADDRRARAGAAFVGFLLLTLGLTYPLLTVIGTAVPSDAGDPILNTWILWWQSQAPPLTRTWWQAPAFFPAEGVLAFSEHLLGLAWIAVPIQWTTGNPIAAYNVAFLLSFALSGWAAYLLAFEVTGRRDAAWAGGALYAFCAYRIDQLPHLQVLSSFGMPLALFALHRYGRDPRPRWLGLWVAAFVQQGLTNGYFLLYFPVLVAFWALWFLPASWDRRRVGTLAVATLVAAAIVAPVLWHYRVVHDAYGFSRTADGLVVYGADITSILTAPVRLGLWQIFDLSHRDEGRLFPGITAPLLVVVAIARARRPTADPTTPVVRLVRRWLAVALAAYLVVLGVRLVAGPIVIELGRVTLSMARVDKLLATILYLAAAFQLLGPTVTAAWRRASPFAFYALAALTMWIFALGPNPTLFDTQVVAGAPYRWLMLLPGYDGLRVSGRFWMLGVLCLSTAAALAFAHLTRAGSRRAIGLAVFVTFGALAESWVGAMPVAPAPPRSPILEAHATFPVLELPMGAEADIAAMYRGIFHHQPVANGYSGYEPPGYGALVADITRRDPARLRVLAGAGVRDIRVDRRADADGRLERYVAAYPGARVLAESADEVLVRLPAAEPTSRAPARE